MGGWGVPGGGVDDAAVRPLMSIGVVGESPPAGPPHPHQPRSDALKLSKRTEYGLRAIVALARLGEDSFVQSKDLSKQEDLPNKFLEAILLALRRGGFLESKVGAGGGYRLSRHPHDIRIGEVVRRLEGRLAIKETGPVGESGPTQLAVRLLNDKLTDATDRVLDELTLEELLEHVQRASARSDTMYYI